MNDVQEKQLRLMRLQTVLLAAILVLLAVAGLFLMKQVNDLSAVVAQVDMDSINRAIAGLETAAGSLSQLDAQMLNETVAALRMAAGNLGAVDMGSLNQAVDALSGAAVTLKDLDIASFNELIASLETAAKNLEKTTSGIAGIFGR